MKVTNRQAHMLFDIASATTKIRDSAFGHIPYNNCKRRDLISEILKQQGDKIIDLENPIQEPLENNKE